MVTKFEYRGQRRIHKKPNAAEIAACAPWLTGELKVVKPKVVLALGATAAQALFGRDFKVSRRRGEVLDTDVADFGAATVHPSSILRSDDREAQFGYFVRDLTSVARPLKASVRQHGATMTRHLSHP